jgi:hypothetical protein
VSIDTCFGGPSVGLFIQSRYPEFNENSIFLLANHGNTKGLKLLLDSKKASPNDADHNRGHTPLHVRVAHVGFFDYTCLIADFSQSSSQ